MLQLPTKSNRSYSELFTSGFRATVDRSGPAYSIPAPPSPMAIPHTPPTSRSTGRHSSFFELMAPHRPHATPPSRSATASLNSSVLHEPDRRSSFLTFSSWLLDRKDSAHSDDYLSFSSSSRQNRHELLCSSNATELWITTGDSLTLTSISKSSNESSLFQPIDPFSVSPDCTSSFADVDSHPPSRRTSKRASSLSSPDQSSLHVPLLLRRERPTSIQTMSLPCSRQSSYVYLPTSGCESDYSWTAEERSSRGVTPEPLVEDLEERCDPAQSVDWRQFHVELLLDDT